MEVAATKGAARHPYQDFPGMQLGHREPLHAKRGRGAIEERGAIFEGGRHTTATSPDRWHRPVASAFIITCVCYKTISVGGSRVSCTLSGGHTDQMRKLQTS